MKKQERAYSIDVRPLYTDYEDHYNTTKKFGCFSDDGASYTVTERNTPRQWMNILYNDKYSAIITNRGEGFTAFGNFGNRVTRYFNPKLYLIRELDGRRILKVYDEDTGEEFDLFDAPSLRCKVTPGCSEFTGEENGVAFCVRVFVPLENSCECWEINLSNNSDRARRLTIHAQQTWTFQNNTAFGKKEPCENVEIDSIENGYFATAVGVGIPFDTMYGAFVISNCTNCYQQTKIEVTDCSRPTRPNLIKKFSYRFVNLYSTFTLGAEESATRTVVSAASDCREEVLLCAKHFVDCANSKTAADAVAAHWKTKMGYNTCKLPDANMERFLNVWLKYQLGLTYRYNRGEENGGYRDLMQDCWGAMMIHPEYATERLLEGLAHVYPDGHTMRVYDSRVGVSQSGDFVDCPLWAPCAVAQYVKETGDFDFLNLEVSYFDSDARGTVEEHLWRMVTHAYENRGANGLLLMRDGDWLDGLAGINQNGTATSAWATMQAYWAQNILAELYDQIGSAEKATELRRRNAEYKKVVREVAWDGKWYVYAFKSDGRPVGSSKCKEGKIFLNPQSWAVLSGLEDDPRRIKSMRRAVDTYLTTMFGPCLLYPPYVNDLSCGRIGTQVPGSFANGAIYLHAASFKVFADVAAGEYDTAYDTWSRLIPNHPDNSDSRRTSEPYCTGNVHFGPDNPRFGMNLFSWFTATPAWLIHGGFDQILGVEAGYDGLHVTPHVPEDWDAYEVNRLYRGKQYELSFRRAENGEEKGIYAENQKIGDTVIPADCAHYRFTVIY